MKGLELLSGYCFKVIVLGGFLVEFFAEIGLVSRFGNLS